MSASWLLSSSHSARGRQHRGNGAKGVRGLWFRLHSCVRVTLVPRASLHAPPSSSTMASKSPSETEMCPDTPDQIPLEEAPRYPLGPEAPETPAPLHACQQPRPTHPGMCAPRGCGCSRRRSHTF